MKLDGGRRKGLLVRLSNPAAAAEGEVVLRISRAALNIPIAIRIMKREFRKDACAAFALFAIVRWR